MLKSHTKIKHNVSYIHRDNKGNIKPLFQENWLYKFIPIKSFWTGSWVNTKNVSNLITTAGRGLISGRINGSGSPAAATYVAIGTGTNAAVVGDTALQTESSGNGYDRAAGSVSLSTTTVTDDTANISLTFTVTSSKSITEAGLLNAAAAGTLLARQVFTAIPLVNGDSLQIIWKIQNA